MDMKDKKQRGLGRGLSALMSDIEPAPARVVPPKGGSGNIFVPIEQLKTNPDQPRQTFDQAELNELAASIREKGIIQPLIVRNAPDSPGQYQIVAGERRWRAAQQAQLHEVPVIIRSFSDQDVHEIALIENIQRSDLNAIEEAQGYRVLMEKFHHTQEKLAEALGKSRSHIANCLRLLNLPPNIQKLVQNRLLSAGHARALVTSKNPDALAQEIMQKGLSVRETEALAAGLARPDMPRRSGQKKEKDADTLAIEGDLSATLKMRVRIDHAANNEGGAMVIQYKNLDQLDDLCRILGGM